MTGKRGREKMVEMRKKEGRKETGKDERPDKWESGKEKKRGEN